jgi:hypothetical protein
MKTTKKENLSLEIGGGAGQRLKIKFVFISVLSKNSILFVTKCISPHNEGG